MGCLLPGPIAVAVRLARRLERNMVRVLALIDFLPVHRHVDRRTHADANLVALDAEHGDCNLTANHQRLSDPSRKNQHKINTPFRRLASARALHAQRLNYVDGDLAAWPALQLFLPHPARGEGGTYESQLLRHKPNAVRHGHAPFRTR